MKCYSVFLLKRTEGSSHFSDSFVIITKMKPILNLLLLKKYTQFHLTVKMKD